MCIWMFWSLLTIMGSNVPKCPDIWDLGREFGLRKVWHLITLELQIHCPSLPPFKIYHGKSDFCSLKIHAMPITSPLIYPIIPESVSLGSPGLASPFQEGRGGTTEVNNGLRAHCIAVTDFKPGHVTQASCSSHVSQLPLFLKQLRCL